MIPSIKVRFFTTHLRRWVVGWCCPWLDLLEEVSGIGVANKIRRRTDRHFRARTYDTILALITGEDPKRASVQADVSEEDDVLCLRRQVEFDAAAGDLWTMRVG